MIYIDHSKLKPPYSYISRSKVKLEILRQFYSKPFEQRIQQTPKFDPSVWHEIKPHLFRLFNNKCAYCESRINAIDFMDFDNFRPKRVATDLDKKISSDHYWWLIYEWGNLYSSCRKCNISKANKFPVEGPRGKLESTITELRKFEKALLIDPCYDDPNNHLLFTDIGEVIPLSKKGEMSIQLLNLNRMELILARKEAFKYAQNDILVEIAYLSMSSKIQKRSIQILENSLSEKKEYSAVLRQAAYSFIYKNELKYPIYVKEELLNIIHRYIRKESVFAKRFQDTKQRKATDNLTKSIIRKAKEGKVSLTIPYITKVEISNFRIIENLTINIAEPSEDAISWVVMLGENGMGKSSILKAITLCLLGKQAMRALKLYPSDFLRKGSRNGYVKVYINGESKPFELYFNSSKVSFTASKNGIRGYLFSYGGTRLLNPGRAAYKQIKGLRRVQNLFDPFLPLADAQTWLLSLGKQKFGFSARAIKGLLMEEDESKLTRRNKQVYLNSKLTGKITPINFLSDGYQTIIAFSADILARVLQRWDDSKDVEGIVLIDEIDVHLHPRWKMQIVGLLRSVFPRMQFIITTHESLCLMGTKPGEVHVLHRDYQTRDIVINQVDLPPGATPDQVLSGFWFGLNSTFLDEDTSKMLAEHRAMLRKGIAETDEKRVILEKDLRIRLGTFQDTSIDRMAQSVASEIIKDNYKILNLEERTSLRNKLKTMVLEKMEMENN